MTFKRVAAVDMPDSRSSKPADESAAASPVGFPVVSDLERLASRDPIEVAATRMAEALRLGEELPPGDVPGLTSEQIAEMQELLPLLRTLEDWGQEKEVAAAREHLASDFQIPELGKYVIGREIGRGGMGVVFEAVETELDRAVAIKILPIRYMSEAGRRRAQFLHEAETIARLAHRNIVPIYAYGQHEGYCFYAMQLIAGVNLDSLIRALSVTTDIVSVRELLAAQKNEPPSPPGPNDCRLRRDSWSALARIAWQVAQALVHAHKHKVLHNDIKPSNLLLDATGKVVVTDFGVGVRSSESADEGGPAMGTLRYMAPERFSGPSGPQSGIYSLGLTLYELLTRRPAFDASSRDALIEQIMNHEPPLPRSVNRDIPEPLETIVWKAIQKAPERRYATAEDMAAELGLYISGKPIETRGPGTLGRVVSNLRQRFGKKLD